MRTHSSVLLATVSLALAACAFFARPQLVPTNVQVEAPAAVRVVYQQSRRDILRFSVYNLSGEMLVVERDLIKMTTPNGERTRIAGRGATAYAIPPGGFHWVDVRFDLSDVRAGDNVAVDFRDAVLLNGQPVRIAPINFAVR